MTAETRRAPGSARRHACRPVRQTSTIVAAKPDRFFRVIASDLAQSPTLTGLCAGYENGAWRCAPMARHMFEWLPEFALTQSELEEFGPHNSVMYLARAARAVYETDR